MISQVTIKDFQSLKDVDIQLGGLTVLVGRSNSGKSAILRAIKALARNTSGVSYVRVGAKSFSVSARVDSYTVSFEKGSASTYRVFSDAGEDTFTKPGTSVPTEIQQALGIPVPEKDSPDLIFATQQDPPFLLASSGSVSAKILGDLTNVSRLQEATREANRRRLESSKVAKIREEDAHKCVDRLRNDYSTLAQESQALSEIEAQINAVRESAKKLEHLRSLQQALKVAHSTYVATKSHAESLATDLPDITFVLEQYDRLLSLREMATALDTARNSVLSVTSSITRAALTVSQTYNAFHEALKEAGHCPLCGAETGAVK